MTPATDSSPIFLKSGGDSSEDRASFTALLGCSKRVPLVPPFTAPNSEGKTPPRYLALATSPALSPRLRQAPFLQGNIKTLPPRAPSCQTDETRDLRMLVTSFAFTLVLATPNLGSLRNLCSCLVEKEEERGLLPPFVHAPSPAPALPCASLVPTELGGCITPKPDSEIHPRPHCSHHHPKPLPSQSRLPLQSRQGTYVQRLDASRELRLGDHPTTSCYRRIFLPFNTTPRPPSTGLDVDSQPNRLPFRRVCNFHRMAI